MLRLWRLCRREHEAGGLAVGMPGGGMMSLRLPAPAGHLPDAGGLMDQPAAMMDAFDAMSAAAQEMRSKRGHQG